MLPPPSLIILAIIALVLHILFGYILVPAPQNVWARPMIAIVVICAVLFWWFAGPVHAGR